jgi:membrane protein
VIPVFSFTLAFALFTVLFAMVFKLLPDRPIAWKDVWVGAMASSLMFAGVRWLITFYFSHSLIATFYGATGSVLVLLIWIYFSMQIFLFGAEFTRVYSESNGGRTRR